MPLYDRTYSEEADEIIGTMPSWIVRWGITLIFVLLALLFLQVFPAFQPRPVLQFLLYSFPRLSLLI